MKTRHVEISASATFDVEEGNGFRTYVARIPGAGETRIEVAWTAVSAFEECVVGRVGAVPVPAVPVPHLLADGVRRDPSPPRHLEWQRVSETWHASGPWVLSWLPTVRRDDGGFARWEGWYLSGPGAPECGAPLGVGDEPPTRAAEAWIAANRCGGAS